MHFLPFAIASLAGLARCNSLRYASNNHRQVFKDSDIVSTAFPDLPDIELLSPAFTNLSVHQPGWSNGTNGPTSFAVMDDFLRGLTDRNGWMSYHSHLTSEEGRPIPYLQLSSSNSTGVSKKLRVYIQAGVHGDEPAGDEGALAFLGKMDADPSWTSSILDKMDIRVLPRYSPDGVTYFQRHLASNLDPNRDHVKLRTQQTRDLKKVFNDFDPHVAVDLHEYPGRPVFSGTYQHASDIQISGESNANIHPTIRSYLFDDLIPEIGERLLKHGLRSAPYVIGEESSNTSAPIEFLNAVPVTRLGRNAMGLTQTLPLLIETRGLKHGDQHFQRRVATTVLSLSSLLEILHDSKDSVHGLISGARKSFIDGVENITIQDFPVPVETTFPMVSRINGSVLEVPVTLQDTTRSIPVLTRPCPAAYLIPRPWAPIAENLRVLGVEVETLSTDWRGTVSTLLVTEAERFNTTYWGPTFLNMRIPYLTAVQTKASSREVVLPAGSFRVRTNQKNAALAFAALEPESDDSYVTYDDIPLGEGDEYPVFRIMK